MQWTPAPQRTSKKNVVGVPGPKYEINLVVGLETLTISAAHLEKTELSERLEIVVVLGYKGKIREGSSRKRLRYAAISLATLMKSLTLSRRISLMICFSPAMYWSFSSGVLPSRSDPIWMRTLSSVDVNTAVCQRPYSANCKKHNKATARRGWNGRERN